MRDYQTHYQVIKLLKSYINNDVGLYVDSTSNVSLVFSKRSTSVSSAHVQAMVEKAVLITASLKDKRATEAQEEELGQK